MATVSNQKSPIEIYSSLQRDVLAQVHKKNLPRGEASRIVQERIGLLNKFQDIEDRIFKIRFTITGIGMHVAHPTRRYMDYTPSKNALSELRQNICAERAYLNSLEKESASMPIEGLDERIIFIKKELETQQSRCLDEIQNVERVIQNYRAKKRLHDIARCLFG